MAKVVVLGGSGAVGSVAVKTLANHDEFSQIVLADTNRTKGNKIIKGIGSKKVTFAQVDALDQKSVRSVIKGCDVVLNCSGPFYKLLPPILKAVIAEKRNYVDICDDVDTTLDVLEMSEKAEKAGIIALIGMGSSPGVTNLLAKFAADNLLDSTDAIDIYHAHGGEPIEGEGVIAHRFHCMTIDVPMFLDGKLKYVKFFEPDGIDLQELVSFPKLGDDIRVYPYPHPEQVTMPRFVKVNRVTNKGTVLPEKYYNLIKDMCSLGLADKKALNVRGQKVVPYDFSVAYILREREKILKETNFGSQRGCVKVVVSGKKDGKSRQFIFSLSSSSQALGEGTGIPAAIGAILMNRGKIKGKGILPPEGCVNPLDFIGLVQSVIKLDSKGKSFDGVLVESVDEHGVKTKLQTM